MSAGKQIKIARPLARSSGVLVENVGDETVIYDLDSKEAHCLKPLAALVFSFADGTNTHADIAEMAGYRLGTPLTEADVADAVAQLDHHGLLDSVLVVRDGLSRRDALLRMAGAAAAAPLIVSVMAPPAHAALTLIETGQCCGDSATSTCVGLNPTCASNHCCQNLNNPAKACNACKCVGDRNDCSVDQCANPKGTCPPLTINGVSTPACGSTSSGRCCYPDGAGRCCTVFLAGGTLINC